MGRENTAGVGAGRRGACSPQQIQLPARTAEAGEEAVPPRPPEPPGHVAMQESVLETGLR